MRNTMIVVFLFFTAAISFAQSSYENAMKDGNIYYDRKEWNKALEFFKEALKANPKSADAQALIGSAYGQMQKWDESISSFNKALTMDPQPNIQVYSYKELGLVYGKMNKTAESIEAFEKGLQIDPKDIQILRNIGISYIIAKRYSDAIRVWEDLLRIDPKQQDIHQKLADARRLLKEQQSAPATSQRPSDPVVADNGISSFSFSPLGGWVMMLDNVTLIVSLPASAELVYIDTIEAKETKRVSLDFKPGQLALQGETLYTIAQGSSLVYALECNSGKVKREFKIPDDPILWIACHPSKGYIFVSTAKEEILALDAKSGSTVKTAARGRFLAVDAETGAFLYTGRTSPNEWDIEVEKNLDGTTTWYFDDWGYRSMIRKYAISGSTLKEVAVNDNAAVNGRAMHLSPDGKKIAMAGGGGWRAKRKGVAGGYVIAIFSTDDLKTMLGQVNTDAYPENITFHPVLNIGVALKYGSELLLFNAKSLAVSKQWKINGAPSGVNESGWLTFGARGTKIVYWQMGASYQNQNGRLYLYPLELASDEKAMLEKYYGSTGSKPAATPSVPQESQTETPESIMKQAEKADAEGNTAKALQLYRKVIELSPDGDLSTSAGKKILGLDKGKTNNKLSFLMQTAETLEKNGNAESALKYYKRVVKEFPQSPEAETAQRKIKELE